MGSIIQMVLSVRQKKTAAKAPCIRSAFDLSIFWNSSAQDSPAFCDPSVSTKSFYETPGRAWSQRTFRLPQHHQPSIAALWRTPQARGSTVSPLGEQGQI